MNTIRSLPLLLICIAFAACEHNAPCIDRNCDDYSYQESAQRDLNADPECRQDLDHDADGIACEHLPSETPPSSTGSNGSNAGGNGCPTTANCGCSNKNKPECPSECCTWVVGEGCKCK